MARRMRIKMGNQEVDALEIEFEAEHEDWNSYKLADGGQVRVKTIVAKIFRVLDADGKPAYNQEGDPNIIIRHRTDVVASE